MPKLKRLLPTWTSLRDTCDKLFSLAIRIRDKRKNGGMCIVCNRRLIQTCYHIIPRDRMGIRWNPMNAVGSCKGCNLDERYSRGGKRDHVQIIWIPRFGQAYIDNLLELEKKHVKWSVDELAELRNGLREQLGARVFL